MYSNLEEVSEMREKTEQDWLVLREKIRSYLRKNHTSLHSVNGILFEEWIEQHTEEEVIDLLLSLGNRRDLSIFDNL